MSFNMRDYVSDDHIESIDEIAKSQSAIIQALSLENSKLEIQLQQKENFDYCLGELIRENEEKDKEIERLNNIINEINSIVEYWGYDKEHNDISSFRMAMKNIKDILGVDKE